MTRARAIRVDVGASIPLPKGALEVVAQKVVMVGPEEHGAGERGPEESGAGESVAVSAQNAAAFLKIGAALKGVGLGDVALGTAKTPALARTVAKGAAGAWA